MRPVLVTLLAALAAASSAPAAGADEAAKPVVNRIDLNKVGLPIVWRGRVVNYVFVTTRLFVAVGRDGQALRAKEPYLRDALVRAAHRAPMAAADDLARVDERRVAAALLTEASRIVGPGAFTSAEVVMQQPRRRDGLPRPGREPVPAGRPITP